MLLLQSAGFEEYDCSTQSYLNVPDRCVSMQVAEEGAAEAAEETVVSGNLAVDYVHNSTDEVN